MIRLYLPTAAAALTMLVAARSASAEDCTEFTVPDVKSADAVKEAGAAEDAVKLANDKLPGDPDGAESVGSDLIVTGMPAGMRRASSVPVAACNTCCASTSRTRSTS